VAQAGCRERNQKKGVKERKKEGRGKNPGTTRGERNQKVGREKRRDFRKNGETKDQPIKVLGNEKRASTERNKTPQQPICIEEEES